MKNLVINASKRALLASKWSFVGSLLLLSFSTCIQCTYSEEWTKGTLLPESLAITKTVPQILEENLKNSKNISPIQATPSKNPTGAPHPLANPKQIIINFMAANYADSGVVPPDAMGVVGPSQFILGANGRIRSFSKATGIIDGGINISTDQFFSPVSNGSFTTDSRIRYDRFSNRWYITILAPTTKPIRILIAVSDGDEITPQTKWNFFHFEPYQEEGPDYPTLGIDKHALYIGVNIFKGARYTTSEGYVIPKLPLLQGRLRVFAFQNLVNRTTLQGASSLQGVDNFDEESSDGFFIGDDLRGDRLILKRIKDPAGTPQISNDIPILIEKANSPLVVPQMGSYASHKFFLQGFDKRLSSPHIRNKSLYTAFNVGVDNKGDDLQGKPTRDGCKWFQFNLADPSNPVIVQKGILYDQTASNDTEEKFYWMPGIMTNGLETLMICCSVSSDQSFANAAYAYRFSSDPAGQLRSPHVYTNSNAIYTLGQPPFENLRWGEYSHVSVDPTDNMTFWDIAESTESSVSWGLQVIKVPSPPPAKITKIEPSFFKKGQTAAKLKITGQRIEGSAFYDGGKSFSKRLKVDIAGVTVLSIESVTPTEIQLTISIPKETEAGFKEVIITNPDDQSVKSGDSFIVD